MLTCWQCQAQAAWEGWLGHALPSSPERVCFLASPLLPSLVVRAAPPPHPHPPTHPRRSPLA